VVVTATPNEDLLVTWSDGAGKRTMTAPDSE
jgi:hypothetical protein